MIIVLHSFGISGAVLFKAAVPMTAFGAAASLPGQKRLSILRLGVFVK
jgi:hypothetical protein